MVPDRSGNPLKPPFNLTTANGKHGADTCEWPPCNWEHITVLSIVLQAAHLFVTLLLSGGRSGEIATLKQNCVEIGRDGKNYLSGYTYKLAGNLFGDARTWPAPDILAQCLGHQARPSGGMELVAVFLRRRSATNPAFRGMLCGSRLGWQGNLTKI